MAQPNMQDFMRPDGGLDFDAYDQAVRGWLQPQINANQAAIQPRMVNIGLSGGAPGFSLPEDVYQQAVTESGLNPNSSTFAPMFAQYVRQSPQYAQYPGANISNQQALQTSKDYLTQKAAENQAGRLGGKIAGLAGGLVASGLGATLLGGLGTATTGLSAGNAAASGGGLGSSLLGNFSTSGAIKGALGGGLSGLASGDGLSGALKGAGLGALGGGFGGALLGNPAGTALDKVSGVLGAQGPTQGTGILGTITRNLPSGIGNIFSNIGGSGSSGGSSMNWSNLIKPAVGAYGYMQDKDDLKAAQNALTDAELFYQQNLQPYGEMGLAAQKQLADSLAAGFNPTDLSTDPGYQFRLQQGQQALNRSLAAQGMGQSGAALKAAQEFGQGLASTEYADAYRRWLEQNQQLAGQASQGYNAAQNLGASSANIGNIRAQGILGQGANRNNYLSALLAGIGLV